MDINDDNKKCIVDSLIKMVAEEGEKGAVAEEGEEGEGDAVEGEGEEGVVEEVVEEGVVEEGAGEEGGWLAAEKGVVAVEDPWDNAINDNKFIIKNKIMRIFPVLKNCLNYNKLLIDDESFSFITIREIAYLTSKIICNHLSKHDINPLKVNIVDYCAGVGGNVISFSKFFNHVYAVEINKTRAEYLLNNLNVYNCKNVTVINNSSIAYNNIGHSLVNGEEGFYHDNPMVVFIDPPWGGNDYKNVDNLKIKLDDIYIEDLVADILDKFNLLINEYKDYNNRFIVLKLPKNFDIELFYNHVKKYPKKNNYFVDLYLYILNKMIIIVCEYIHVLTLSHL